jgi:hypothetical protein
MSVICPSCQTPAEYGAVFCDNCGANLQNVQAAPQQPAPAVASPAVAGIKCPNCGFENVAGSAFCENCGFQLGGAAVGQGGAAVATTPQHPPVVTPAGFVTGRLVIQASNTSLQIPTGKSEVTLGREDPVSSVFPEIDLDPHGGQDAGVGRQHCKLIAQGGQVFVEDLNSVNGSFLNKQKLIAGQRTVINAGDELRLGKMVLVYYPS